MQIVKITKKALRKLLTSGFLEKVKEKGLIVKLDRNNLTLEFYSKDPFVELKGKDVLTAFSLSEGSIDLDRAIGLFSEDTYLKVIDLGEIYNQNEKNITRILSRIIVTNGKTKILIEELTESSITIYEDKIFIIGFLEEIHLAHEAIDSLMAGTVHKKVYALLERGRRKIREEKMRLWKGE
jgi:ribosomal RNA assembly protein